MKKGLLLLGLLLGSFCTPLSLRADPASETLLLRLREKMRSYTSYRFRMTVTSPEFGSMSGLFTVSGQRFSTIASPGPENINPPTSKMQSTDLYCDGVTFWRYTPKQNEVVIESFNASGNALTSPAQLLSLDPAKYEHRMLPSAGNTPQQVVELKPKSPEGFSLLRLYIDSSTGLPVRLSIDTSISSSSIEFLIQRFEANVPVSASDFQFNPAAHPGIEIIDFR